MLKLCDELVASGLKALLLSGGYGTRLRPLTNNIPKCLVPIGGVPIIDHWLDQLNLLGCESILVNTHHLANQVTEHLSSSESKYSSRIQTVYEADLLGTAGTLIHNLSFFGSDISLLIHVDNLMMDKLDHLIEAHCKRPPHCLLTMLTFKTTDPSSCGIVRLDDNGVINFFHEKSNLDNGHIANGAVYCFGPEFLKFISEMNPKPVDFSLDVIPAMIGRMFTYHTLKPFVDIGSPERLQFARQIFENNS